MGLDDLERRGTHRNVKMCIENSSNKSWYGGIIRTVGMPVMKQDELNELSRLIL